MPKENLSVSPNKPHHTQLPKGLMTRYQICEKINLEITIFFINYKQINTHTYRFTKKLIRKQKSHS